MSTTIVSKGIEILSFRGMSHTIRQRMRRRERLLHCHGFLLMGLLLAAIAVQLDSDHRVAGAQESGTKSAANPKPTGFGCYAYMHELGGLENWRTHVKLMKTHGMNTFAIFTRGSQDVARQIDIAIEEGMLEGRVPIFLLDHSGIPEFKRLVPDWEEVVKKDTNPVPGWTPGRAIGTAAVIAKAREISKYPDQWPEIITYSVDEPGRGNPLSDKELSDLGRITTNLNAVGFRCGTACIYPNVKNLVPLLDVIAVASIVGGDLKGCKQAIEAGGKEFWMYHTGIPKTNLKLARWLLGYWTWQVEPASYLAWNWNGFIQGDMADPKPTDVLLAYAQGVEDFKLLTAASGHLERTSESGKSASLQAIEKRFKRLQAGFRWEGLPMEEFDAARAEGKPWHETVPELDLNNLVREAKQVISVATSLK